MEDCALCGEKLDGSRGEVRRQDGFGPGLCFVCFKTRPLEAKSILGVVLGRHPLDYIGGPRLGSFEGIG